MSDSSVELFGAFLLLGNGGFACTGYEALKDFDLNKDESRGKLKISRDINSNGQRGDADGYLMKMCYSLFRIRELSDLKIYTKHYYTYKAIACFAL